MARVFILSDNETVVNSDCPLECQRLLGGGATEIPDQEVAGIFGGDAYLASPENTSVVDGVVVYTPKPVCCSDVVCKIDSKRDAIIKAGYAFGGNTYQIREIDIANFDRMLVAFNDGRANPHGGQWATKDNMFVSLTDAEMKQLAIDATTYRDSVLRARSIHVYTVSSMTDEQAAAYDIDAGWPANGV